MLNMSTSDNSATHLYITQMGYIKFIGNGVRFYELFKSFPIKTNVLDAQKKHLSKMFLFSTQNIYFD